MSQQTPSLKLVIEIEFGNDAMQRYSQASSLLKGCLGTSDNHAKPCLGDGFTMRDVNGNRVGFWEVRERGE
jgi:hypothetical protein